MTILLVEDNPDEEKLAMLAFERSGFVNRVVVARDGQQAIDYMFAQGEHLGRDVKNLPSVIFLDINLPKINGLDVLKLIRKDERTKLVPIVLLTTSDEDRDIAEGYSSGANSYIRKPFDFKEFMQQIKTLGNYWLELNQTPHTSRKR